MSDTLVPTTKTPLLAVDVYLALRMQWSAQVGSEPTRAQLLTLLAQIWLETGAGGSCFNFNLGGIKHVNGDGRPFYSVQTHEVIGGVNKVLVQPFRAYASLAEGAADYLHLIRTTFGFAWPAVETADIDAYAHALHVRGYYTASEHDYAAALHVRYKQLDGLITEDTQPAVPIAIARSQPPPGTDDDPQPTPPGDLPPDDAA
jgi:flagellum-specific peptidoglycan hydrolase FlgJ